MSGPNLDLLELEPEQDDLGLDSKSMPSVAPEASTPAIVHARLEPEPMPLMQILPADFRLPALIHFVPNLALKKRVDDAIAYAKSIEIAGKGQEALTMFDAAKSEVDAAIKAAELSFEDAAGLAFEVHRNITGTRGAWVNGPKAEIKRLGNEAWKESERLKAEAEKERRRLQDEANIKAREEAEREAAAARKNQAPAQVVQKLEERAKTAVAPPVAPPPAAPAMTDNTIVTTFKARLASTPEDAEEVHPELTRLSKEELANVQAFFRAIADGRVDLLALVSLEWGALDKLAVSQENTFNVPGFVAFKTGGTRKKAQRGRR